MSTSKILSVLIIIVGVLLIITPFGYQMFDRATAGAHMMSDFEPVLTRENVDTFQGHMETFAGMQEDMNAMLPAFAQAMGMSEDQLNQMIGDQFPQLAKGMQEMDTMGADFNTVITVMDNNVENFQKANQLPMKNMPWFFIIAGAIVALLGAIQLFVPDKK